MEQYKSIISDLVLFLETDNAYKSERKTVERHFQMWKNTKNKEDVKNYFDDDLFGLCYARKLYNSRVDCFHQVLKRIVRFPEVKQIMKQSRKVISFGCGPGPEIAAYISFVRNDLDCLDQHLDIAAVDQLSYWEQYIHAVSGIDKLVELKFVNQTINLEFLRHIARSDVCIMSYPHAVDFDDIWELLKIKFKLIIVIDQAKTKLLDNVQQRGYRVIKFIYKKIKTCFLYFDPNVCYQNRGQLSENYNYDGEENRPPLLSSSSHRIGTQMVSSSIQNALITRQLICGHFDPNVCYQNRGQFPENDNYDGEEENRPPLLSFNRIGTPMIPISIPNALIKRQFSCGHSKIVKRSEWGQSVRCEKIVEVTCPRNLHLKLIVCGQSFICEELCEKILSCNHSVFIKCSQMEIDHVTFRAFLNHQLECENVTYRSPLQVRNLNHPDITCHKSLVQKIKKRRRRSRKKI